MGVPQAALWQVMATRLEPEQNFFQPVHDGAAFAGAHGLTQTRAGTRFAQARFDTRKRPLVFAVTGNFGITAAEGSQKLSEPLAVIIAIRTMIIPRF
jgi:hypothetical protein